MIKKKKTLLTASVFYFFSSSLGFSMNDDVETYKTGFTRAGVVATSVAVGAWLGEKWAVDITTKIIKKSINSGPPLFDLTIGSAIKGRSLIEAIPIAAKTGTVVGGVTAAFLVPVAWDCGTSVSYSFKRVYNALSKNIVSEQEQATKKDYIAAGVTSLSAALLLYSIFGK